jgi:hypothetical protein
MIKETFEDYLKTKHAENYMGTDDDMADSFDDYISNLQIDETIVLADEWVKNVIEFAQTRIKQIKGVYSAHQAIEEVDRVLESLK